jgi:hypothetical protein
MPLEDSSIVDLVAHRPDGRLQLIITDSGAVTDEERRRALLAAKVEGYRAYVRSPEFAAGYPGRTARDCEIVVKCRVPPSKRMLSVGDVPSPDDPTASIPITFEVFDPWSDAGKLSDAAKPNAAIESPREPGRLPAAAGTPAQMKLFKATLKNDFALAKEAVAEGADVNVMNVVGQHALTVAVLHDNTEMVSWLFERGATFPPYTVGGRTLWISANAKRNEEIKALLVKHGARPKWIVDRLLTYFLRWKRKGKLM